MAAIRSLLTFRLSSCLWLMVATSLGLAWYSDHQRLRAELTRARPAIGNYWEKHGLWSPSIYLSTDTDAVESRLTKRITSFSGRIVPSSQGMSQVPLRQPSTETLEAVIGLLDDADTSVVHDAAQLLALYLEAASGRNTLEMESLALKSHFHRRGLGSAKALLQHPSPEIRRAAALILGNTIPSRSTLDQMIESFDRETDAETMLHLAWAYYTLTTLPQ